MKGPGDVLSLWSLWLREHSASAVSMTHVKAIILDEKSLTESLAQFPRVLRCWSTGYKTLVPILESKLTLHKMNLQGSEEHDEVGGGIYWIRTRTREKETIFIFSGVKFLKSF